MPAYPPVEALHAPTAVVLDAGVVLLDGNMWNDTQFVPSTVASNVMVALCVPVICTAALPLDGNPSTVAASFCAATVTTADFSIPPGISHTPMLLGFC